jgi:uncharacterized protein (TIRG00374 family)
MATERRPYRLSNIVIAILFAVGLGLLGMMIAQVGIHGLQTGFHALGPWLLPYLMLESVVQAVHTGGWVACLPARQLPLPYWRFLLIRLAGNSIDEVTPTAAIGGEVAKVLLLEPWMRYDQATAMVVIDKASITLAKMGFLTLGVWYTTQRIVLPLAMQWSVSLTVGLISLVLASFVAFQRYGALSKVVQGLQRLGMAQQLLQRLSLYVAPLDSQLKDYYTRHGWRYLCSLLLHFSAYAFEIVKIYILLRCLLRDQAPGLAEAAMITVLITALDQMFFFVPARLGTLEGSRFLVLSSLGIGQIYGLAFGLIARLEKLVWSGIGLLVYALCSRSTLPVRGWHFRVRQRARPADRQGPRS